MFFKRLWKKVKKFFGYSEYHIPRVEEVTPVDPPTITREEEQSYETYLEKDRKKRTVRYYSVLFATMVIGTNHKTQVQSAVNLIKKYKARYMKAQQLTGVDWRIIGVIHYMEASCNFDRQILNGQRWWRRTSIVPKRKGPWKSWEESCIAAFKYHKLKKFDIASVLKYLERYNGLGYIKRGINSPYLWSFCNHYNSGKYIRDGKYSPTAVSEQVGGAILLKKLGY